MAGGMGATDPRHAGVVRAEAAQHAAGSVAPWAELVHLAVETDESPRLLTAAARLLRAPLGLVDSAGAAVGHAPHTKEGRRALAVAAGGPRAAAPGGAWTVIP